MKTKSIRTRNNFPQWIKQAIESLSPGQHFIIPSHLYPSLDESNFRTMISATNRRFSINLKVHRDTRTNPPSLWVWYCPDPRPTPTPSQNVTLIRNRIDSLNSRLQSELAIDDMDAAMQTNSELETLKRNINAPNPNRRVYRNKNSITFPLDTILEHLHISREEWNEMDATKRLHLRIKTEIAIKFALDQSIPLHRD